MILYLYLFNVFLRFRELFRNEQGVCSWNCLSIPHVGSIKLHQSLSHSNYLHSGEATNYQVQTWDYILAHKIINNFDFNPWHQYCAATNNADTFSIVQTIYYFSYGCLKIFSFCNFVTPAQQNKAFISIFRC